MLGIFSRQIDMAHMGAEHDVPAPATPSCKLLICTAPRTASFALCDLIRIAGLGQASEYCSTLAERRFRMRTNSRTPVSRTRLSADYLHSIMPLRTVQGVFASKIQHRHVKRAIRAGLARELFDGAEIVFLFRKDLRDQAVSYAVSKLTDTWGPSEKSQAPTSFTDAVLRREYVNQLRYLAHEYSEWHTILNSLGLEYTSVSTEQFLQDPVQTVRDLFRLVNARVDEQALAKAITSMKRYPGHQQLKRHMRDVIVPSVDHHEVLRARYLVADQWRLSMRNLFG